MALREIETLGEAVKEKHTLSVGSGGNDLVKVATKVAVTLSEGCVVSLLWGEAVMKGEIEEESLGERLKEGDEE